MAFTSTLHNDMLYINPEFYLEPGMIDVDDIHGGLPCIVGKQKPVYRFILYAEFFDDQQDIPAKRPGVGDP